MTEHLPECWFHDPAKVLAVVVNDGYPCICDRLRACERRLLEAAVQRVEARAIPHHIPLEVTCDIWNQVIGECIAAIKGDQS